MPKNFSIKNVNDSLDSAADVVSMQSRLRVAIFDVVSEEDVRKIVEKQIAKAKDGDAKSLEFVMKYVLGFGHQTTLQQINVLDVESAARIASEKRKPRIAQ